jgi:hypothetical protein
MDFVDKGSNAACVLQCGGLWFGGKGWGITWKLIQAVVKPSERQSVFGKCHIQLSSDEVEALESQPSAPVDSTLDEDEGDAPPSAQSKQTTLVEDSDAEEEEQEQEPVQVVEAPKKKVVKKAVAETVVEASVQEEAVAEVAVEAPKKKVVKKKV